MRMQLADFASHRAGFPWNHWPASFGGVNIQESLLLPSALRAFRLRAGLSQKALALWVGVDQSVLCAVERGRRPALADSLMERVCQALALNEGEQRELSWRARHDGLVRDVYVKQSPELAELVSAALVAYANLPPTARAGLIALLKDKARSGAEVRNLESKARVAARANEETNMT